MNWQDLLRPGPHAAPPVPGRSTFDRDFDRVLFSTPFRRLQGKTQVFPLPDEAFVHTRLTHSLEVSTVARSLGKLAGAQLVARHPRLNHNADDFGAVVAAAALAHDIGNPPFGHSGEQAIGDYASSESFRHYLSHSVSLEQQADLTRWEGNAQGFRLLVGDPGFGSLSYPVLAAFTKYPSSSLPSLRDKKKVYRKKYGLFQAEVAAYGRVAEELGLPELVAGQAWARHPLAYLVEAADDICYSIIDLEDGYRLGLLTYEETTTHLGAVLGDRYQPDKLDKVHSLQERIGMLRAVAIGHLVQQCVEVFIDHEEQLLGGTLESALTDLVPAAAALKAISDLSYAKLYKSTPVLEKEIAGYEVIHGLVQRAVEASLRQSRGQATGRDQALLRLLPEDYRHGLDQAADDYGLLLLATDWVSSLTDAGALAFYRRITGISL